MLDFDLELNQEPASDIQPSTDEVRQTRKKNNAAKYATVLSRKAQEQILQDENATAQSELVKQEVLSSQQFGLLTISSPYNSVATNCVGAKAT
jgi:hypothetical protein